jgi:hypothetical protein
MREVMQSVGYPNLSAVIAEGSMDTLRECTTKLTEVATIQGMLPAPSDADDCDDELDELAPPPAEISVPLEDDEIARLVAEAEDLAKRASDAAKAVAAAASSPRVAGMTAADREKIAKIEDMVLRHDADIGDMKTSMEALHDGMDDVKTSLAPIASILDAIKASTIGTTLPPVVTATIKAVVSGDRLLSEVLPFFTPGVQQGNQIPCVASPPSFGKTFMSDEISRLYDGSFFHPFKDSLDEVDSLVGTLMPRSDGTFAVIDGPLVSAARLASTGVNTLFIGDEIFNASKKTLEWMQSFLSPRLVEVVNPDGTTGLRRCFVIQTKHSLEDGTFEVIKAPEECLHFLFLGNLRTNPPEALMSRCRLMRFDYEEKWAAETALQRLEGYSGGLFSGSDADGWAKMWAKAMTASREAYSRMEVSRPLCFRFLIGAVTHIVRQPDASLGKLTDYVFKWAPHQIAVQNAATQDTDKSSADAVKAFLSAAFPVSVPF